MEHLSFTKLEDKNKDWVELLLKFLLSVKKMWTMTTHTKTKQNIYDEYEKFLDPRKRY